MQGVAQSQSTLLTALIMSFFLSFPFFFFFSWMHVVGHNFNSSGRGRTGLISGVCASRFIWLKKKKEMEKKNTLLWEADRQLTRQWLISCSHTQYNTIRLLYFCKNYSFSLYCFLKTTLACLTVNIWKWAKFPPYLFQCRVRALGDVTMGNHTRLEAAVPGGYWQWAVIQQDVN